MRSNLHSRSRDSRAVEVKSEVEMAGILLLWRSKVRSKAHSRSRDSRIVEVKSEVEMALEIEGF